MKNSWWPKLGAALLIVLAGTLALMGKPTYLAPVENVEGWGKIVAEGRDRIDPVTVGEWLVEERPGVRVIDVRPQASFARYSIPGSENMPLEQLLTKQGLRRLSLRGIHVLVSEDGSRAAQAWVVLRGMGYEAYIMNDGLHGWVEQVLEERDDINDYDVAMKVHALREAFLGDGAAVGSAPPPPPPVETPAAPPTRKKKKAGGC